MLLEQGYQVTGSDLRLSLVAETLANSGAVVFTGHDASNLGDADTVLVSSAIPDDNLEVVEARRRGLPVFKRAEFLGHLTADKTGIAVAGTHGKTTTTSMIVWILTQADLDPTFIVGGVIQSLGTNARAGRGSHFVIEADEYDHMFLGLRPTVAAITHLEHDHPDCFPTFDKMRAAFGQFVDLVPPDGLIVGCGDHLAVAALLKRTHGAADAHACVGRRPMVQTCGLGLQNDWQALQVAPNSVGGHDFEISRMGERWGRVRLRVPGIHNVQNATIALAIADWLDVDRKTVCRALETFSGVGRRFEVCGQVDGITVVDDYGHHPTEIRATLAAARARYGERPLWAVFQPHTYSRLKALWDDFTTCFTLADHVIVLDVYAAREIDTLGLSAADLVTQMEHPDARHIADFGGAADHIVSHAEPSAVIITLSAGDGNQVGVQVLRQWGAKRIATERGTQNAKATSAL